MARVRLDRAKKVYVAQNAAAPLVARTANRVLAGARRLAPKGAHTSGSGRASRGPTLKASLKADMFIGTRMVRSRIGSTKRYAATIHQTSTAHTIRAKGKLLKFRWDKPGVIAVRNRRGGFYYFRKVRHPGNKHPVRYLTIPLGLFGTANGFRIRTAGLGRSRLP